MRIELLSNFASRVLTPYFNHRESSAAIVHACTTGFILRWRCWRQYRLTPRSLDVWAKMLLWVPGCVSPRFDKQGLTTSIRTNFGITRIDITRLPIRAPVATSLGFREGRMVYIKVVFSSGVVVLSRKVSSYNHPLPVYIQLYEPIISCPTPIQNPRYHVSLWSFSKECSRTYRRKSFSASPLSPGGSTHQHTILSVSGSGVLRT